MERPWNRSIIRAKPQWALLLREQVIAASTLAAATFSPARSPLPRFVVQSMGRSGSTLLTDLLSCHPNIECDGEILSHRLFITSAERFVRQRARLFPKHAYGFKMRPPHYHEQGIASPSAFLTALAAEGWVVIHLERRNHLRIALSWIASMQTQVMHRTFRASPAAPPRVHVPIDLLFDRLDRVAQDSAVEQQALQKVPCLRLSYEDDIMRVETRQAAMNRLFGFLGLPSAQVSTRYVRLTSDRLEDFVENPRDIVDALRGTAYEQYLDDDSVRPRVLRRA